MSKSLSKDVAKITREFWPEMPWGLCGVAAKYFDHMAGSEWDSGSIELAEKFTVAAEDLRRAEKWVGMYKKDYFIPHFKSAGGAHGRDLISMAKQHFDHISDGSEGCTAEEAKSAFIAANDLRRALPWARRFEMKEWPVILEAKKQPAK